MNCRKCWCYGHLWNKARWFIFWNSIQNSWVFSPFCLDCTAQKMKFSIKDFFSKCEQICSFLRIGMENFIFCLNRDQNGGETMMFVREDIPGKFLFFENKLIETKCILNQISVERSNFSVVDIAWKVPIFGVFLVCIFPDLDWIRTRKAPNTDTFHAVSHNPNKKNYLKLSWTIKKKFKFTFS